MYRLRNFQLLFFILVFSGTILNSCTLFKPLPLLPYKATDSLTTAPGFDISGNYEILSADTSIASLDYTFTYKDFFYRSKPPSTNDYVNIIMPDKNHLAATLYINGKPVKTKTVKGRWTGNYFEFHNTHFKCRFIINVYSQQTCRIWLSKNGDLYLDTNRGGIAFLLLLPIPLSGSQYDLYHLLFKRKGNTL